MWRQVEIDGNNWFLQTTIATDDKVDLLVFNPTDVLCEKVEFNSFFARVKQLNKRIQYKEDIVRATLRDEQPTEATLTPSDDQCAKLKLKYRISGRPLVIEWHLNKQSSTELIRTLVMPLLKGIHELWTQNGVLRTAVRKKDEEIKQYRFEHGDLRRKTVATKMFDFDSFDLEHKNTNSWCDKIQGIGACLATFHEKVSASAENCVKEKSAGSAIALDNKNAPDVNKRAIKSEEDEKPACSSTNFMVTSKARVSPRNRKRQFKAQYEERTAHNLRTRKKRLEYNNSQTSSDGSQDQKLLMHHEQTTNGMAVTEIEHDDFKIDTSIDQPCSNLTNKSKPPQTELSAEVDSILRELEELEQRRLSDLQQHTQT